MQKFLLIAVVLFQVVVPESSGTISGRLLSAQGTPIEGVRITAVVVDVATPDSVQTFASLAQTDINGRYKLENIPPGKYVIAAGPVNAPVFYPNGPREGAMVISIAAGSKIESIDFKTTVAGDAFGRLLVSPGLRPRAPITIAGAAMPSTLETSLRANSSFAFANVMPGFYNIAVSPAFSPNFAPLWITAPNAGDIVLKEIIGRVEVDSGAATPPFALNVIGVFDKYQRGVNEETLKELSRIPVSVRAPLFSAWGLPDPQMLHVEVNPTSREAFRLLVPEGSYFLTDDLTVATSGRFFVKSATYGPANLLTAPLEIKGPDRPEIRIVLGAR